MTTKYNIGDTVLVPMTVKSIEINVNEIRYRLFSIDTIIDGRDELLDESGIHSRLKKVKNDGQ